MEEIERYQLENARRAKQASEEVKKMILPPVSVNANKFSLLGRKFEREAVDVLHMLVEKHAESLEPIMDFSLQLAWQGAWQGALWARDSIANGLLANTQDNLRLTSPEGYGESEGWAWSLYGQLSSLGERDPDSSDVLYCMSLHFFALANQALSQGKQQIALAWIFEATECTSLRKGDYMWECATEKADATNKKDGLSRLARAGAAGRHRENYALKATVFAWCDKHMSEYSSIDKAAQAVAGVIVPLSFRTVQGYISEWSKIRSAGRL